MEILIFQRTIDMSKFTYDDVVRVSDKAPLEIRPSERAWIVGVFVDRPGEYYEQFPLGTIYSIEFEDGSSLDAHESMLDLIE
jgi:hypothetical protein